MLMRLKILTQASLLVGALVVAAPAEDRKYVVILGSDADAAQVAASHGMRVQKSLTGSGHGVHVLLAPRRRDVGRMVHELATDPAVRAAEADGPVTLPGINAAAQVHPDAAAGAKLPVDGALVHYFTGVAAKGYVRQTASHLINNAKAHKIATGQGAVVAVLDTGVDLAQPVLANSVMPGWDFINDQWGGQEVADTNQETTPILDQETTPILDQETTPILDGGTAIILDQETTPILDQETTPILDQETTPILDGTKFPAFGHGTMVAGLIHLVAPKSLILPVRVFAADGTATVSQVVEGIYWAVDQNVNVINMSFSTRVPSNALSQALDYAHQKGVILVTSAGNDGADEVVYPGSDDDVIDVASIDNQGVRSLFSNFGNSIALAAPGEGVITTYPGEHYAEVWGTSFSAPLVSGGAALLVGLMGELSPQQAKSALTQAVFIGQELGAGQLDLLQVVNYLKSNND